MRGFAFAIASLLLIGCSDMTPYPRHVALFNLCKRRGQGWQYLTADESGARNDWKNYRCVHIDSTARDTVDAP